MRPCWDGRSVRCSAFRCSVLLDWRLDDTPTPAPPPAVYREGCVRADRRPAGSGRWPPTQPILRRFATLRQPLSGANGLIRILPGMKEKTDMLARGIRILAGYLSESVARVERRVNTITRKTWTSELGGGALWGFDERCGSAFSNAGWDRDTAGTRTTCDHSTDSYGSSRSAPAVPVGAAGTGDLGPRG